MTIHRGSQSDVALALVAQLAECHLSPLCTQRVASCISGWAHSGLIPSRSVQGAARKCLALISLSLSLSPYLKFIKLFLKTIKR